MKELIINNELILMEAAIVEQLRRSKDVQLHASLVNAPLIYDPSDASPDNNAVENSGRKFLSDLYQSYINVAKEACLPLILCTPTWRANKTRVAEAGAYNDINRDAAHFMKTLVSLPENQSVTIKVGGLTGCKNDCYRPEEGLNAREAEQFHSWQIQQLKQGGVDFLIAETLPAVEEATGIARAMEKSGLPYIISFVINRDAMVLDGTPLYDAIRIIDSSTSLNPLGFMVNCAYPTFVCADKQPEALFSRLIGYQANASSLDQCELDNNENLHIEPVSEWGDAMLALNRQFGVKILGGCCGTDKTHLQYLIRH